MTPDQHRLGIPDVLDDGTPFTDLQAAIQAAWLAGERTFACELLQCHQLFDKVCVGCAEPSLKIFNLLRDRRQRKHKRRDDNSLLLHLCDPCSFREIATLSSDFRIYRRRATAQRPRGVRRFVRVVKDLR